MTKYRGNPWAILLVLSLGFFMTLLDLTIVNIAIPNMITKLDASLDDVPSRSSGRPPAAACKSDPTGAPAAWVARFSRTASSMGCARPWPCPS